MYTFEMYPRGVTSLSRFYPADELISRETTRNKSAILYLIDVAGCVYTPIGKKATHCGPFNDDLEISRGWQVNPNGDDSATGGAMAARRSRRDELPGRTPSRPVAMRW